jgi:iron-sulfur cluster repair protein YtfE (RIC family)
MRTQKAARSSRGAVKATELLKGQHREVKGLFRRVEGTRGPRERRRLLERIGQALKIHTAIEEKIFYPAIREIATEKAEDLVLESLEEHHVVDLVLAELPRVDPADERFEAKMTVLKELVEHHAKEEEEEMFPMAERKLGDEKLRELGQQMDAKVRELKQK